MWLCVSNCLFFDPADESTFLQNEGQITLVRHRSDRNVRPLTVTTNLGRDLSFFVFLITKNAS
jgi:hypothetical protein